MDGLMDEWMDGYGGGLMGFHVNFVHIQAKRDEDGKYISRHCPSDTGFEIRALATSQSRRLSTILNVCD